MAERIGRTENEGCSLSISGLRQGIGVFSRKRKALQGFENLEELVEDMLMITQVANLREQDTTSSKLSKRCKTIRLPTSFG